MHVIRGCKNSNGNFIHSFHSPLLKFNYLEVNHSPCQRSTVLNTCFAILNISTSAWLLQNCRANYKTNTAFFGMAIFQTTERMLVHTVEFPPFRFISHTNYCSSKKLLFLCLIKCTQRFSWILLYRPSSPLQLNSLKKI